MTTKHIAVIGGGISGLAFANRVRELCESSGDKVSVTLVEAEPRFGGVIESFSHEGFLMEGGPESFITEKPWAENLCKRLGLADELIGTRRDFRRSFIYRKGKLRPVPEGFYLMGPGKMLPFLKSSLMSWPGKLRMMAEVLVPARRAKGDESVASFIRRRFGAEALREAGQPMIAGIYSADPEKLSLAATFPAFLEWERKYGSVIRGLRARARAAGARSSEAEASGPRYGLFVTLRGGMETLVKTLREKNSEARMSIGSPAVRLHRDEKSWRVLLGSGREIRADAVCVALPGPRASRLLAEDFPVLAAGIASIRYASSVTVNLAYKTKVLPSEASGFGFVVPAVEKSGVLGCTFTHLKYEGRAPDRGTSVRVFLGGAQRLEALESPDELITMKTRQELSRMLGITEDPVLAAVRRYPDSMPQYEVGHLEKSRSIFHSASALPGLFLAGNAYTGIGLPDCIHLAETQAEKAMEFLC